MLFRSRVDGRLRLVEGLALPREEDEFNLTYYSTNSCWINVDRLLDLFGLTRDLLQDPAATAAAVRQLAARVPTYVTLKDVKVSAADAMLDCGAQLARGLLEATPVLCAYKVGGCKRVYEMSLNYAGERKQFNTVIGRFPRVQDQIGRAHV